MSARSPAIEFVNHSSFIVEYANEQLICDPWLAGTAFNAGWRLLAPSALTPQNFDRITKIWFSHQHPDHFSPGDLRRIPAQQRARIDVLFQRTIDKKVVRYCKGLKFRSAAELLRDRRHELAPGLSVLCNPWSDRDSWLAIYAGDCAILNVNDCVIETDDQTRDIARAAGPVDVLFTQFSYASWSGNPGDREAHAAEARRKLDQIRLQVRRFKPRYVVPFASLVWFSHEENFFHNEGMNQIGAVAEFIERELGCEAVVLYPGDRWTPGEPHDWRTAAAKYFDDYRRAMASGPADRSATVPIERVTRAFDSYLSRIKRRNPLIGFIPGLRTTAHITDYGRSFEFTLSGMQEIDPLSPVDVRIGSDSLHFIVRAPWGANALSVNGRYVVPPGGDRARFFRFFRAGDYNDLGYSFDIPWAANQVAKAISRRLRSERTPAIHPAP